VPASLPARRLEEAGASPSAQRCVDTVLRCAALPDRADLG